MSDRAEIRAFFDEPTNTVSYSRVGSRHQGGGR